MIKVEIINKEEVRNLFKNWGEFACECYNTPKKYAEKVGKSCYNSGHYSGSRGEYIKFKITGISRSCSLQLNRHNIGVMLNQQSQRYVDMKDNSFVIPPEIEKNEKALELYETLMDLSKWTYLHIQDILKDNGRTKEQANEDARFCLLESCETSGAWGFTIEALIHFMNMRLCKRSQWEIRQLAIEMRKAVLELLPELKDKLVPNCIKNNGICYEDKCCGLNPKYDDFKVYLNKAKELYYINKNNN